MVKVRWYVRAINRKAVSKVSKITAGKSHLTAASARPIDLVRRCNPKLASRSQDEGEDTEVEFGSSGARPKHVPDHVGRMADVAIGLIHGACVLHLARSNRHNSAIRNSVF